jgi:hypothetical protein
MIYNYNYLPARTNKYYLQKIIKIPNLGKVLDLGCRLLQMNNITVPN